MGFWQLIDVDIAKVRLKILVVKIRPEAKWICREGVLLFDVFK